MSSVRQEIKVRPNGEVQLPRARHKKSVKIPTISREAVSWNELFGDAGLGSV
jgi:hypothetical protein